jgi:hypothetical protein
MVELVSLVSSPAETTQLNVVTIPIASKAAAIARMNTLWPILIQMLQFFNGKGQRTKAHEASRNTSKTRKSYLYTSSEHGATAESVSLIDIVLVKKNWAAAEFSQRGRLGHLAL